MSKVTDVMELVPRSLLFYTIVEPRKAKTRTDGGLLLAQETQETERLVTNVGRIRHLGALAYQAETPGLDYKKETPPKVGDWIVFQRLAGLKMTFVLDTDVPAADPENTVELILLTDTDLGAVLTDKQVKHLVGWTGAN